MTPYDVKVKGTFAEPPKKVKLPPRKPTSEEQRANNLAPVEFSRESASVGNWIPLFRKELAEMNSGKVGRPYSFCDSMIFWIMALQTLIKGTYRTAAGLAAAILEGHGMRAPSYSRLFERSAEMLDRPFWTPERMSCRSPSRRHPPTSSHLPISPYSPVSS